MLRPFLILALIIASFSIKAQSLGLQLGADYVTPVGQFGHNYKPTPSYRGGVSWFLDNVVVNFTYSMATYQPQADTLYYLTDDGEDYGTASYKRFKTSSFTLGFLRYFPLSEVFKVGVGADLGGLLSHYTYRTTDRVRDAHYDLGDTNILLSGKTGLSFDASENISINFEARYNVFTPTGKNDKELMGQSLTLGDVYNTWSAGFSFGYRF